MTKDESLAIKGVAIVMMVFYHLFCRYSLASQCESILPIADIGKVLNVISRCANPVSLYLLLSGYGLYAVNEKGDTHRWSRILKLLEHYWVITIPFVLLGCVIKPSVFPGSVPTIIENITAFKCTYNSECWFLLPYLILSATSGLIYKVIHNLRGGYSFAISFIINLAAVFSIHYLRPEFMDSHQCVKILYLVATLQYPFVLGMLLNKYRILDSVKLNWIIALVLLVAVSVVRCSTSNVWHTYYILIFLFLILQIIKGIKSNSALKCLKVLGSHSLNIWMIHSWFCYHLFEESLYAIKSPALIFAVTLLLSLFLSSVVEHFFFRKKNENNTQ